MQPVIHVDNGHARTPQARALAVTTISAPPNRSHSSRFNDDGTQEDRFGAHLAREQREATGFAQPVADPDLSVPPKTERLWRYWAAFLGCPGGRAGWR
jgi:hypothetical protein